MVIAPTAGGQAFEFKVCVCFNNVVSSFWDVTAVAWLLNDNNRFMWTQKVATPIPTYDNRYAANPNGHLMEYVYFILRDELWADVIKKLTSA